MPASPDIAAYQTALPPSGPSESAMEELYRHALGPIGAERYLPIFQRFDETGRATTGWNGMASLFTLGWMAFRQLWGPALAYLAAVEGLGLLLVGVVAPLLEIPAPITWGIFGTLALLSVVVPGLFGDALLHGDIHKRVTRALASTATVPEACALLARQASGRGRLIGVVVAHAVIVVAALAASLIAPRSGYMARLSTPDATVARAPSPPVASGPVVALPGLDQNAAPTALPLPAAQPEQVSAASNPTSASASAPAASALLAAAPAPAPTAPEPPAAAASAAAPARKATSPAPGASGLRLEAPASSASVPAVGSLPGHYINVGLFAEEANARRTQARLLNEGLPAFRQPVESRQGPRIRVRVGPFKTEAQAQSAARSIRTMGLEAQVFYKPAQR